MPILTNPRREHFAQAYLVSGNATKAYITAGYSTTGASQSALRLLKNANVCARIQELQQEVAETCRQCSIRKVESRLESQQLRWERLRRIIDERAADPNMQHHPGASTGLMVRTEKRVGGTWGHDVWEYEIDTGLLREMRELEDLAAVELGQRVSVAVVSVTVNLVERLAAGRQRVLNDAGA